MIFRQHSHEGDDTTLTTTTNQAEAAGLRRRIRATFGPFSRRAITGPPPAEHCTPTRPCEACRTRLATRRKDTPT